MFKAISVPVIGEQSRVNSIAIEVFQLNLDVNFATVANEVRIVGKVQSVNMRDGVRNSRPYIDRVSTPSLAVRVGLGNMVSAWMKNYDRKDYEES